MSALDAYLNRLPEGLNSYPEFRQKASVFRDFLRMLDFDRLLPALPNHEMRQWVQDPPGDNCWISEVHTCAVMAAAVDSCFDDDDGFQDLAFQVHQASLSRPLYRGLMSLLKPSRVMKLGGSTWRFIHEGSSLAVVEVGDRVELILQHPPHAYCDPMVRAQAGAFLTVAHLAGQDDAAVSLTQHNEREARFIVDWQGAPADDALYVAGPVPRANR